MRKLALRERTMRELAMRELSMKELAMRGLAMRELAMRGLAVREKHSVGNKNLPLLSVSISSQQHPTSFPRAPPPPASPPPYKSWARLR